MIIYDEYGRMMGLEGDEWVTDSDVVAFEMWSFGGDDAECR